MHNFFKDYWTKLFIRSILQFPSSQLFNNTFDTQTFTNVLIFLFVKGRLFHHKRWT